MTVGISRSRNMVVNGNFIDPPPGVELAEQNGTSLGEEYFANESFAHQHRNSNDQVTLTKRPYTMSDLLNTFSAVGLWIEGPLPGQPNRMCRTVTEGGKNL
jgi:hypothetical protein